MPGTFPQSARSEGIVEVLLFAAAHTMDLHTRSLPSSDRGLVQSQKAHGERQTELYLRDHGIIQVFFSLVLRVP